MIVRVSSNVRLLGLDDGKICSRNVGLNKYGDFFSIATPYLRVSVNVLICDIHPPRILYVYVYRLNS